MKWFWYKLQWWQVGSLVQHRKCTLNHPYTYRVPWGVIFSVLCHSSILLEHSLKEQIFWVRIPLWFVCQTIKCDSFLSLLLRDTSKYVNHLGFSGCVSQWLHKLSDSLFTLGQPREVWRSCFSSLILSGKDPHRPTISLYSWNRSLQLLDYCSFTIYHIFLCFQKVCLLLLELHEPWTLRTFHPRARRGRVGIFIFQTWKNSHLQVVSARGRSICCSACICIHLDTWQRGREWYCFWVPYWGCSKSHSHRIGNALATWESLRLKLLGLRLAICHFLVIWNQRRDIFFELSLFECVDRRFHGHS